MEKALFIARSPYGKELHSMELSLVTNIFTLAHKVMDLVAEEYQEPVHCCEVWTRTDHHNMYLLVTVF